MKKWKRITSAFLALMVAVTMLPLGALAEETVPDVFTEETAAPGVFAPPVAGYVDEEDNDSMATANYIGLHLGSGCYGDLIAWDPDYYTFNTSAYGTGTFEILVEVASFYENFTVALLDGKGNTLCYETDEEPHDGGYVIRFSKTVTGGTFYLSISTMDSGEVSSSYAFTVTVKDGAFACTHPYADSEVTMPTCVDKGYTTCTCIDCGKIWKTDYTEPTGKHTYSDAQDTNCDVCGAVREAVSDGGYCGDNVTWQLEDGILTISGTGGMYGYGYDYWAVAAKAPWQEFADSITTVIIEEGVTSIGKESFSGCKALTSVTIPDSMKVIREYAFYNCSALASVVLPQGVTGIYERAFYGCKGLTGITIPESVTSIEGDAFGYAGLKTIHFLGKPEKIHDEAFSGVKATAYYVENQWKASSRKDYGGNLTWTAYTIQNCPHPAWEVLEAVAPTCTKPGLTEGKCCAACGKLSAAQQEIPALGHKEKASVTEPTCVDQGYTTYTCQTCKESRKADFTAPTGVHTYTDNQDTACNVCGEVREAISVGGKCGPKATWELCDGVLTISGTGAMYDYCAMDGSQAPWRKEEYTVEKVVIQKGVTKIGSEAFRFCTSLTAVTIPEGVKSIGEYAFDSCISLASITIPESVTKIGSYAFQFCESLTEATIHAGITDIPKGLFAHCKALASVMMPQTILSIGEGAFEGCEALPSVAIPEGVTAIGNYAFQSCKSLQSVILPESVTGIGYNAFQGCSSLSGITLPEGIMELSSSVFFKCGSLKEITIPAGVTRIGDQAFGKCSSLETIIFKGDAPEFLKSYGYAESEAFYLVTADVHYPADNPTWTEEVRRNYGGSITWVPEEPPHVHSYTESVTKPTCTEDGYTTYTCACGDSYVADYVGGGHILSSWKHDSVQHWLECTVCEAKLDAGNHDGAVCTVCGYETPGEPAHEGELGDVNHDGKINAKDATLILQKSVGVLKSTAKFCETCAEVSGDGKLNAKDSTLILQFSVGLRTEFPGAGK